MPIRIRARTTLLKTDFIKRSSVSGLSVSQHFYQQTGTLIYVRNSLSRQRSFVRERLEERIYHGWKVQICSPVYFLVIMNTDLEWNPENNNRPFSENEAFAKTIDKVIIPESFWLLSTSRLQVHCDNHSR